MARRAEKAAGDVQPKEQKPQKDVDVIDEVGLPNEVAPVVEDGGQTLKGPVVGDLEKEAAAEAKVKEEVAAEEAKDTAAPKHAPVAEEKPYGKKVLVKVLSRYDMFQHISTMPSGGYHLKAKSEYQKALYDAWLEGCLEAGLIELTSVVDD